MKKTYEEIKEITKGLDNVTLLDYLERYSEMVNGSDYTEYIGQVYTALREEIMERMSK